MLEVETNEEGTKKLMEMLGDGNILYTHQTISDSLTTSGESTNLFNEIILPRKELEKKFKLIISGHIHNPSAKIDKTIIAGSVFCNEVNETQKYIYKINEDFLEVEKIKLPGRGIYGLTDPTEEDLNKIPKKSILKVTITKETSTIKINELKEKLKEFDAFVLLSQIPHQRKKLIIDGNKSLLEFSVEQLLSVYAKEKSISLDKLTHGFDLIK